MIRTMTVKYWFRKHAGADQQTLDTLNCCAYAVGDLLEGDWLNPSRRNAANQTDPFQIVLDSYFREVQVCLFTTLTGPTSNLQYHLVMEISSASQVRPRMNLNALILARFKNVAENMDHQ